MTSLAFKLRRSSVTRTLMSSRRLLVISFLVICICSNSCYSLSVNNNILEEASSYDISRAYPIYYGLNDDEVEREPKFSNVLEYGPDRYDGSVESDEAECPEASPAVVSVEDFGAKGDGVTDDTEAFEEAWNQACTTIGLTLVVPKDKNYLVRPIRFSGPCRSDLTIQIYGTIQASDNRTDYQNDTRHWLMFDGVQDLIVEGGGTFDGKGQIWWNNSCKINKTLPCTHAPTALTFYECMNLRVRNIRIKDAQQMHLVFEKCVNVQASNLMVTAPGKSPNTDGIHVTHTQNIHIMNCVIGTGDDCISIVDGARNIQATDITCGPGHGISIGSLGADRSEAHVTDVKVDKARLHGTTNGVRIKTWQGGSGSATKIIFQNIIMENVSNPIIIDQHYCDKDGPCKEQSSAVQVKDVVYKNIKGTSASKVAIKFDCSVKHPCKGILLENINLTAEKKDDEDDDSETVKALCKNVGWTQVGSVSPSCPKK